MPNYTLLNEDGGPLSDRDTDRAAALARRHTELTQQAEQEGWRRQELAEMGMDGPDLDDCERCEGRGFLGLEPFVKPGGPRVLDEDLVGIECNHPDCDGGLDYGPERRADERRRQAQADRDLELELITDKLAALGCRMMRPYEHWNEEEAWMQYQEVDRHAAA